MESEVKKYKAPGKSHRVGITMLDLAQMFPDENVARAWFEGIIWADGRVCPNCGSDDTHEASHAKMPYRCRACRRYFSVKTGTVMAQSPIPLQKWAYAIYLDVTSLKGVSSMKLHRDLGVTQKTAWFMQQRIREAFAAEGPGAVFEGPVEVDETYVGGKAKNMHAKARREKITGRGSMDKTPVVGIKDRATNKVAAKVVDAVDGPTLRGFVDEHADGGAMVYTDGATAYSGRENHEAVAHSVGEYVWGQAHTNGVESFWAMLKRAHHGTFHRLSAKHLHRYVAEFCGRHNIRDLDTAEQMGRVAAAMGGRRIDYETLTFGERGVAV